MCFVIVPALHSRRPPEIARVGFFTRTKLPGVFCAVPDLLAVVAVVALPLLLSLPKTLGKKQNMPGNLVRVKNPTRAISGGRL